MSNLHFWARKWPKSPPSKSLSFLYFFSFFFDDRELLTLPYFALQCFLTNDMKEPFVVIKTLNPFFVDWDEDAIGPDKKPVGKFSLEKGAFWSNTCVREQWLTHEYFMGYECISHVSFWVPNFMNMYTRFVCTIHGLNELNRVQGQRTGTTTLPELRGSSTFGKSFRHQMAQHDFVHKLNPRKPKKPN